MDANAPPEQPDLINTLPDGCLINIISRVELDSLPRRRADATLQHPIHCALVCRHWASLADHAVTCLHFEYEQTWDEDRESLSIHPSLGPSLPRVPFLLSLRFKNLYPEDLASVLRFLSRGACPLLETFEYSPPRLGPVISSGSGSVSDAPRPQDLDGAELGAALRRCPRLVEVVLRVEHIERGAALNVALCALPALVRLDVAQIDRSPLPSPPNRLFPIFFVNVGTAHEMGLHAAHEGVTQLRSLAIRHRSEAVPLFPSVGSLPLLEKLTLEYCFYSDLPATLSNLANLRVLQLVSLARLESLPASLGHLHRLERLEIVSCPCLTSLPESLGDLSSLRRLCLDFCRGVRELPASFARLSSLEKLTISQSLDALPESVGALGSLRKLKVDCGGMAGLPDSLGLLRALASLYLYGKGPKVLPETLGQLEGLRSLEVNIPSLTHLPASIGHLSGLTLLKIGPSEVALPEALGDLRALRSLTLCLCSRLPDSLGQLEALETLSLVQCRLASLPESIGRLGSLQELSLLRWEELPILPECLLSMKSLQAVVITTVQNAPKGHRSLPLIKKLKEQGVLVDQTTHYKWFDNL